ncbi:MAG TPA: peptide-methionine (R)-S-oxide reductase, partial [Rhodospirillales bacterium]|nr:peptide-methionine (R)-S-oxide reductase [Rhodospirillales bacterium]
MRCWSSCAPGISVPQTFRYYKARRARRKRAREMTEKLIKSEAEWRGQLSEDQYWVTREKGTERPFTGEYHGCKTPGTFV